MCELIYATILSSRYSDDFSCLTGQTQRQILAAHHSWMDEIDLLYFMEYREVASAASGKRIFPINPCHYGFHLEGYRTKGTHAFRHQLPLTCLN